MMQILKTLSIRQSQGIRSVMTSQSVMNGERIGSFGAYLNIRNHNHARHLLHSDTCTVHVYNPTQRKLRTPYFLKDISV